MFVYFRASLQPEAPIQLERRNNPCTHTPSLKITTRRLRTLQRKRTRQASSSRQHRTLQQHPPPPIRTHRLHITAIMATELAVQSERAYQKQPHIFQNAKTAAKTPRKGKGGRRWYKDVGLGFRTPKTAIEGNYIGV